MDLLGHLEVFKSEDIFDGPLIRNCRTKKVPRILVEETILAH